MDLLGKQQHDVGLAVETKNVDPTSKESKESSSVSPKGSTHELLPLPRRDETLKTMLSENDRKLLEISFSEGLEEPDGKHSHHSSEPHEILTRETTTIPQSHTEKFWHIVGNKLFKRPHVRQMWGQEQDTEKVAWLELFYDLIFVAALANLAKYMEKEVEYYVVGKNSLAGLFGSLGMTFLFFVLFWSFWSASSMYWTRFQNDDFFTFAVFFAFNAGVVGMSTTVLGGLDNRDNFSFAMILGKASLVLLYLQVMIFAQVPQARNFAKVAVAGETINVILYLLVALVFNEKGNTVYEDISIVLWGISIIVEHGWAHITYRIGRNDPINPRKYSLPVNVQHLAERFGLFILLAIGESVLSLISGTTLSSGLHVMVVGFGFAIVYSLKFLYYNVHPEGESEGHALRRSRLAGVFFIYSHVVLGAALLFLGTGLKLLNKTVAGKTEYDSEDVVVNSGLLYGRIFSYSLGVFLVVANILRLVHKHKYRVREVWFVRVLLIGITFALPDIISSENEYLGVVLQAIIMVIQNLVDHFGSALHDLKEMEDEEKLYLQQQKDLSKSKKHDGNDELENILLATQGLQREGTIQVTISTKSNDYLWSQVVRSKKVGALQRQNARKKIGHDLVDL